VAQGRDCKEKREEETYWPLRGGTSDDALAASLRDKPSLFLYSQKRRHMYQCAVCCVPCPVCCSVLNCSVHVICRVLLYAAVFCQC
jgi:hypothetical protein